MRVLAMMSIYLVHSAITDLRIGLLDADTGRSALDDNGNPATRALSMAESVQAGYCFRICRSAFGLLHIDVLDKFLNVLDKFFSFELWAPPSTPTLAGTSPIGSGPPAKIKKVKASPIRDKLDDTEIDILAQNEVDDAFAVYRGRMGADPMKKHEPTAEQISALKMRIVTQCGSVYADFSVRTPFGRRTQKSMKTKRWKQSEMLGPPNLKVGMRASRPTNQHG
jgi:hypothetical protein